MMSPHSYQGNTTAYNDSGIAVDDDLPDEGVYPSGCSACAAAAWIDTLHFIQYLCM